eukprot:174296_1
MQPTRGYWKELKSDAEWGDKLVVNGNIITWMVKKDLFYSFWSSIDTTESNEFTINGSTWCLRFHPLGNGKQNAGQFSIYLVLKRHTKNTCNIGVNFTLKCNETSVTSHIAHTFKKEGDFYGVDQWFNSSLLQSQYLLTITCTLQQTLTIQSQNINEVHWTLTGHLLQLLKGHTSTLTLPIHDDTKTEDEQPDYYSPTFQTNDGSTWQIMITAHVATKTSDDTYYSIHLYPKQLPPNTNSIGVNYRFELIEIDKTLKGGNTFTTKPIGWNRAFTARAILSLDCLTIKCKAQQTMITDHKSSNADIMWTITGDLLQQMQETRSTDSFLSPVFCRYNIWWQIKMHPVDGVLSLCCHSVASNGRTSEIGIRYRMICPEIGYTYYNPSQGSVLKPGTCVKNTICFDFEQVKSANQMTVRCNVWQNMKRWQLNVKDLRYSMDQEIIFRVHEMQWKMRARRGSIGLDLNVFPAAISTVMIQRKIVCDEVHVVDERIVTFCNVNGGQNKNMIIKYEDSLLNDLNSICITCYIDIISLKPLYNEPPRISFDSILTSDEISNAYDTRKLLQQRKNHSVDQEPLNITECNKIFEMHRTNITSWSDDNLRFQIYEDSEDIDDVKEQNGLLLFETHGVYHDMINEQQSRIKQASRHGIQLGEVQRILIKYMTQQTKLVEESKTQMDAVRNEYETTKQSRLKLQQVMKEQLMECNDIIATENKLASDNHQLCMDWKPLNEHMEQLQAISNICVGLIDEYNEYIDANKKKIDTMKRQSQSKWELFESRWMQWTFEDIIGWFKYNVRQRNTNVIEWDVVKRKVMEQHVVGKTLNVMTENGLLSIGIQDYEIRNHLFNAIAMLRSQYPSIKINEESDYQNIPLKFKCKLTQEVMKDPVIAFDGYTYERIAILRYLKEHNKSPVTKEKAFSLSLFPNDDLKQEIIAFNMIHKTVLEGDQETQYID